ncbi:hypothetical protein AX14_011644 [Amanita brunnescens Koide BX004]|nr:hypothetical protein AX14_011644 [Amanita brunnescens Koide BX004]
MHLSLCSQISVAVPIPAPPVPLVELPGHAFTARKGDDGDIIPGAASSALSSGSTAIAATTAVLGSLLLCGLCVKMACECGVQCCRKDTRLGNAARPNAAAARPPGEGYELTSPMGEEHGLIHPESVAAPCERCTHQPNAVPHEQGHAVIPQMDVQHVTRPGPVAHPGGPPPSGWL